MKIRASEIFDRGFEDSFFQKFIGGTSEYIIQRVNEKNIDYNDSVSVMLEPNVNSLGVIGDAEMVGKEMHIKKLEVKLEKFISRIESEIPFSDSKNEVEIKNGLAECVSSNLDKSIIKCLSNKCTNIIYSGNALNESSINENDTMNMSLLKKIGNYAESSETVRPVRIGGCEFYVLLLDSWQLRDLQKDPKWWEIKPYSYLDDGESSIFKGASGVYNKIIIQECYKIPRTNTGDNTKVGHALLLGAQAVVIVLGDKTTFEEREDHQCYSIERAVGFTATDSCIKVMTSSVDD